MYHCLLTMGRLKMVVLMSALVAALAVAWASSTDAQEYTYADYTYDVAFGEQTGLIPAFPFRGCVNKIGAYRIGSDIKSLGGGKYCFKIKVNSNCTNACCSTDLYKIEFNVSDSCIVQPAGEVKATINGVPTRVGATYDRPVNGRNGSAILRLTQLGLNLTTAANAEVCLTLKTNRLGKGCGTLEQMCVPPPTAPIGVCSVAMFDKSMKCCPVSSNQYPIPNLNVPPSPPPPSPSTPPPPPSPST
ncbi:hypothetical protein VaNZ11_010560, partial [Volvox africanus]